MSDHPSRLALDRARLGDVSDEVDEHLATCSVCRAYVEEQFNAAAPAWTRAIDVSAHRRRRWLRNLFLPMPMLGAVAVTALALLWLPAGDQKPSNRPYIGTKAAAPVVQVFLRHNDRVTSWTGQSLVRGDQIQLRVMPAGFSHISVLAKNLNEFVVLHRQTVPKTELGKTFSLSRSFRVDASASENQLVVVLSHRPLTQDAYDKPPLQSTSDVWVADFNFGRVSYHE